MLVSDFYLISLLFIAVIYGTTQFKLDNCMTVLVESLEKFCDIVASTT